ncbi:MAG: ABC transporter substrate-binding protein [Chloroflexales bacterium]|nr:ABC transporter substrate-binding protein [Chloroflexales bacterium]
MRTIATGIILSMMLSILVACGGTPAAAPAATATTAASSEATAAPAPKTLKIVASTSWVAAFAKAAGATDITVIAPSNLQHPPDYDPKPSDLVAVNDADFVLMAGFEGFAKRMLEAVGGDSPKLITVATENSPDAIHKEVTRLAELFGTQDHAKAYLADFDTQYADLAAKVKTRVGDAKPVVVTQLFMTPFVFFAGLTPAGSYGPMPMTPEELKKLSDLKPTMVFENSHMPAGQAIIEATGATKVDLINFPGDDLELLSVFRKNADTLIAAFGSAPTATTTKTQYPVTINDCGGRETVYAKAPEKIVTLDPAITESLLILGLKDKIVGFTEFQEPDQRWAPTKADMDALPVINKDMAYPSKEAVIAVAPDFVTSVYPSALLSNADLPDRDGWSKLGINSYLTLGECHLSKTPVTDLSLLYTDLRNLGIIFDVQDRAEAEIAKLQTRVEALQKKVSDAGLPALTMWSYSGEKDPYPAGGVGTPNAIMTIAGTKNAFGDVARDYDAISWEEIVKRNPDVIWVMTAAGEGMFITEAQGIQTKLEADPRLKSITAIKNKAYVIVSYNEGGVETPRNVDAIERMVDGLIALKK